MLKHRIFILLLLITSCANKRQKPTFVILYSQKYAEKLNGNVKRLIEKSPSGDYSLIVEFNENGDMVSSKSSWATFIVTEGKKEKNIQKWEGRYVFSTNADGKNTALTGNFRGDGSYGVIWELDSKNGNVSRFGSVDTSDDVARSESLTKYDKSGNLTEWSTHSLNAHNAPYCWKYRYDDRSHLVESAFSEDGVFLNRSTYNYPLYDQKGNWVKKVSITNAFSPMPDQKNSSTTSREITYY